jgi:two-component system sensor histidine kinase DegS
MGLRGKAPTADWLRGIVSKPAIWILIALFLAVTFFQVGAYFKNLLFLSDLTAKLGLTRYTIERILYLLPITWAAFSFGWTGGASTSLAALACMLPRALFESPLREDALVETGAVFLVGNLVSYSLQALMNERKRRVQLERAQKEEEKMQDRLHFLLQQITRAQEEERKRIARELHDDTIQALVFHYQQIYDLTYKAKDLPQEASARINDLLKQTNNIIEGLRRLSQDLRPAALDRLGLLAALKRLATDISARSGIAIEVRVIGNERRLPTEVELVLFRIAQEALNNTWKHAKATSANITLEFGSGKTRVTISDNGKGFNVRHVMQGRFEPTKLGLAGMMERAKLLGGTLSVSSQMGKGTTLTAELPI